MRVCVYRISLSLSVVGWSLLFLHSVQYRVTVALLCVCHSILCGGCVMQLTFSSNHLQLGQRLGGARFYHERSLHKLGHFCGRCSGDPAVFGGSVAVAEVDESAAETGLRSQYV